MPRQPGSANRFYRTIQEAIADITEHGFDSQRRIDDWMERIRQAATATLTPLAEMEKSLRDALGSIYKRLIERGGIIRMHPGVSRFTLTQVKPKLRAELDKRIMASAQLIRLNRAEAIEKTLRRFSGWSSSIPPGGSRTVDRRQEGVELRKAMYSLPFVERRVLIDQGHKFAANLSEIVATDGGAIAGIWRSHWREPGYDYREDHKERDELVYTVRDNWAQQAGLMRPGKAGYTDQITKPGEEVYCRCRYQWVYALGKLPEDMLTAKGRRQLLQIREAA